jgi:hypothetical protein
MKISGLSIQAKTRDGLFEYVQRELRTPSEEKWRELDERHNQRVYAMLHLLHKLETLEGPDIWVGTSWGLYNFNLRDVTSPLKRVPEVLTVETYEISRDPPRCGYRLDFNLTGLDEHRRKHEFADLDEACDVIVRLLKSQQAQLPIRFI